MWEGADEAHVAGMMPFRSCQYTVYNDIDKVEPLEDGDYKKIRFCRNALQQPDPFAMSAAIESELEEVISWVSKRSSHQVRQYRENVVAEIEALAAKITSAGLGKAWLQGVDPETQQVPLVSPPI